ncbi:MgtC/SapB family protein [Polymorphobacter fuscus]|uniref:DUF4010 domain-containing protein n=1 Tax=Sandarakinorhabdus fusca TaxID=1439888 RepID=A0A7C9GMX6_9SPHN|nr:DUF4010 domain-containing protein [Polymorphobacter fuscus]KAB7648778.1 DUF4010 domain-containing protein [Polymorphobacter fuscus]MQT16352.1 DUF4010 domain-containing protein [Polymorphobacter fuscus]NJC07360.1 uncharacterized membrane protein (DUF4010 family) [Polymorphobacter fuscus]
MGNDPLNLLVALAIGLLIGLERERSKGAGPRRGPAGIRTFAIAALAGAAAGQLGGPLLVAAVVAAVAVLAALAYRRSAVRDPGLTTEVALLLTPLLGALAMSDRLLAAMLGVVTAALLAAKPALHRFVRTRLTDAEVGDGLVLAIVAIVVWPLLPDRAMGPAGAINPHMLGLVAILVLAIGAAGHVAVRALGPRFGLAVSGLASGFVSSVATIGAMGARARAEPPTRNAAVAGAALSSVATFVQMGIVLAAVSMPTLRALTPSLVAGGGVITAYGAFFAWRASQSAPAAEASAGRAFSLVAALVLVAAMAGILVLTAVVQPLFGQAGVTLGAALGGIVDTHAAAMGVASLVAADRLAPAAALVPVLAAMTANAAMKISMAIGTGGRDYALRIGAGVTLSMLAAWAAMLV